MKPKNKDESNFRVKSHPTELTRHVLTLGYTLYSPKSPLKKHPYPVFSGLGLGGEGWERLKPQVNLNSSCGWEPRASRKACVPGTVHSRAERYKDDQQLGDEYFLINALQASPLNCVVGGLLITRPGSLPVTSSPYKVKQLYCAHWPPTEKISLHQVPLMRF